MAEWSGCSRRRQGESGKSLCGNLLWCVCAWWRCSVHSGHSTVGRSLGQNLNTFQTVAGPGSTPPPGSGLASVTGFGFRKRRRPTHPSLLMREILQTGAKPGPPTLCQCGPLALWCLTRTSRKSFLKIVLWRLGTRCAPAPPPFTVLEDGQQMSNKQSVGGPAWEVDHAVNGGWPRLEENPRHARK